MSGRGTQKGKGRWLQEEIDWGTELAPYYDEEYSDEDEQPAEDDTETAEELRGELTSQLRRAVPEGAKHGDLVPGSHEDDLTKLLNKVRQLTTQISTADLETLESLRDELTNVETELSSITETVGKRREEKDRIAKAADDVKAPDGAEETEQQGLTAKKQLVTDALAPAILTEGVLETARKALEDAKQEATRIGVQVEARRAENTRIGSEAEKIKEAGHLEDQKQRMTKARADLSDTLKPPITTKRNEDAVEALRKLMEAAKEVSEELVSLGGTDGITALCGAAGVGPEQFAELEKGLGGRKATAEILKHSPRRTWANSASRLAAARQAPRCLGR